MSVPGHRHDPLQDVVELARKADEIDHDSERSDDHSHVFHWNIRPAELSVAAIDGPNSLLFILLACCVCANAKALSMPPIRQLDPKEEAPARERRGQNQVDQSDRPCAQLCNLSLNTKLRSDCPS